MRITQLIRDTCPNGKTPSSKALKETFKAVKNDVGERCNLAKSFYRSLLEDTWKKRFFL